MQNTFRFCNKCPTHSRYFDSDGYWCCKHPAAGEQDDNRSPLHESGDPVPVACMENCPAGHWKRTIEGGKIPKDQTELVVDSEWIVR